MIPDPSFPSQQNMAQAMAQADMFVQQTRMQAQMQMTQQQAAFTGGIGGAQPGLMGFAGQAAGGFGAGFVAQMQQQAAAAVARASMVPAAGAALGVPAFQQFGNVIEGARSLSAQRMSLAGMLTAGFAPTSVFPQAGAAFNMEQRLMREMAREETGRRFTQIGRAGLYQTAGAATYGVSSFLMRRSGLEASWLGEMEAERGAQRNLGYLRGGPYESATGMGKSQRFFTEGAGREYMGQIMGGAKDLQRNTGMNVQQIQMLTELAQQAVDPTRGANYAAGGAKGMREMGREVNEIRRTMAQMSQAMQMAPEEAAKFFSQLNQVMKVTDKGLKDFQEQNRRMALGGPFSEMQVAQIRMQGMQMGRQLYMGGTQFGTLAMQQADVIAQQRRTGVIRDETLLREGGGLDQAAMARMMMQRLQGQAQAVQAGNFNVALTLAGNTPQAFSGLMAGGAGYFQTQASYAATMIRNPFALQEAWRDPDAMRRVTGMAPGIAYQQSQQLGALMGGVFNGRQMENFKIQAFGRQLGIDTSNAVGFNQAVTRYEEIKDTEARINQGLAGAFATDRGPGGLGKPGSVTKKQMARYSSMLLGFTASSGASAEEAIASFAVIRTVPEKWSEFKNATTAEKAQMLEAQLVQERVDSAMNRQRLAGQAMGEVGDQILGKTGSKEGVVMSTGRAIERIARRDRISNYAASKKLLGTVAEGRDVVSISGAEKDLYAPAAVSVGIPMIGWIGGLGMMGYRALTDSQFLKDEYEFKHQKIVANSAGMMEVQNETFDVDQKKFKSYMDQHQPGWRNWKRKEREDKLPKYMREFVTKMDVKSRTETVTLRPGTKEYDDMRKALASAGKRGLEERESIERMENLKMILGRAPAASGALAELGITGGGTWEDIQKKIATLEENPLAASNERLRSLISVASMEKNGEYRMDLQNLKDVDIGGMRKWFKEYAATEAGADVMAGKDAKKMSMSDMEQVAQGMSDADKKRLFNDLAFKAIEKSQRMIDQLPMGSMERPNYVIIKGDMRTPASPDEKK